ncbi:hypothetical protein RQP46_006631 [Phenoliferia psychrophenolica]
MSDSPAEPLSSPSLGSTADPRLPPELLGLIIQHATDSLIDLERTDTTLSHQVIPFLLSLLAIPTLSPLAARTLFQHALITPLMGTAYLEEVKNQGMGSAIKSIRVMPDQQLDSEARGWEGGSAGAVGALLAKLAPHLPALETIECLATIDFHLYPHGTHYLHDRAFEAFLTVLPTFHSTTRLSISDTWTDSLYRLMSDIQISVAAGNVSLESLRVEAVNGMNQNDYGVWDTFTGLLHLAANYQALPPTPSPWAHWDEYYYGDKFEERMLWALECLPNLSRVLIAAEGKADELLATLSKAQAYAETYEPGCIQYRISHDPNDKHKVCVFEVFENQAALDVHIATEVSKNNVACYAAGGLARPLEEMDIRVYTEYRQ